MLAHIVGVAYIKTDFILLHLTTPYGIRCIDAVFNKGIESL